MRVLVLSFVLIVALVDIATGQPEVFFRDMAPMCHDTLLAGRSYTQVIAINNPDQAQSDVQFVIVFRDPTGTTLPVPVVEFYGSLDPAPEAQVVASSGRYYIAVHLYNVPVSAEPVDLVGIRITPPYEATGAWYGFDSSSYAGLPEWSADPGPQITCGMNVWYAVATLPNCCICGAIVWPELANSTPCAPMTYQYRCTGCSFTAVCRFAKVSGPGTLDSLTGVWTFVPTAADAGTIQTLVVSRSESVCAQNAFGGPEEYYTTRIVVPSLAPPSFSTENPTTFLAQTGVPLFIALAVEDADPCTSFHRYHTFIDPGKPNPPISVDSLSGLVTYLGASSDTNHYGFSLVVAEGNRADTAEIDIYHFESSTCGDLDHGRTVDVGDLTWMVDYLFFGGMEPVPFISGDINCDQVVDIGDLSALVEFLFFSGPAPCSGCK